MGVPSAGNKLNTLRRRRPAPAPVEAGSRCRYLQLIVIALLVVSICVETCVCDITRTFGFRTSAPAQLAKSQKTSTGNVSGGRSRTMVEAAFENAGEKPGIEIWRVEDFKPVRYPKNQYGKFYTGDSYIILNTKVNKNGQKSYDIHFWLGSETSQDEAGAAAILAVQLDDMLDGVPVQHREVQDHESQLFLSYFKGGVRYQPGGVSSGFHHVDTSAFEKKLFQVKGSRNIRVKQVVPSIASMNDGDCFILDVGRNIYVYVGKKARRVEKLKAINAANQIRDQDHAGKATVTIVDEFSPESDFEVFFQALGEGSRSSVPEDTVGADDQQFETTEERQVGLYRVSDKTGSVQITSVSQKPLDAAALDPQDCFILDTGDANIYVWIGKQCDDREKRESMKKADEYLKNKNYPKWTHVERIIQNAEPAAFTQYFRNWQGHGETRPRLLRSISEEARLFHCQIRGKTHKLIMEEITDFTQQDLWEDDVMVLDLDDEVFVWIGKGTTEEERRLGPKFVEKLLHKQGRDDASVTIVNEGEEPEDFKRRFPSWDASLFANLPDVRSYIVNEN